MDEIKTLLAKEAIRDQIYVYCRALDRIDNELGYSVFAEGQPGRLWPHLQRNGKRIY